MPTFRKRNGKWQVEIYVNGQRKAATLPTKGHCIQWAKEATRQLERTTETLLSDVFERYSEEVAPTHKGYRWERIRLEKLIQEIGDHPLHEVTPSLFAKWRDKRLKKVQPGTVRREIALIKSVLETAVREWEWLDDNPMKAVKAPPNPKPRDRLISQSEISTMKKTLGYRSGQPKTRNQEVAVCFMIALETAMRASEILKAEVKGSVATLIDTKNGDKREVPLSTKARKLYSYAPFHITAESLSTLFRKARHEAGLEGFTFHDSRATALTRLSKKLDVLELARMVGHRDPRSLMCYYRESAASLAKKLG